MRRAQRELNDPTPEQIHRETEAIRSRWTENERIRRGGERPLGWLPPVFPTTVMPYEETADR